MWALLWLGCASLTVHDVTSGESEAYPELRSIHETVPKRVAWDRAEAAANRLWRDCAHPKPFTLICADDAVFGEARVTVWLEEAGPKAVRVVVRSETPGKLGDFGKGKERILAFQREFYAQNSAE